MFRKLIGDRRGVTLIEYSLLASLISVVAITAMVSIGTHLISTFDAIATAL